MGEEDGRVEKREEVQVDKEQKEAVVRSQVPQETWTEKDESKFLAYSFDVDPHALHSFHKCRSQRCNSLSSTETKNLSSFGTGLW